MLPKSFSSCGEKKLKEVTEHTHPDSGKHFMLLHVYSSLSLV